MTDNGYREWTPEEMALYRTKARRLHPDAGGSAEAFRELQEAYEAVKRG